MRLRAEDRLATLKVINRAFAGGPAYQELFKQLLTLAKDNDSSAT